MKNKINFQILNIIFHIFGDQQLSELIIIQQWKMKSTFQD